jgi:YVTN family beta-propeller protein
MDRRRFVIGSLLLVAVALAALPTLASARIAYITGASQVSGAQAVRWELPAQTEVPPKTSFGGESSAPDVAITPDGKTAYVITSSQGLVPFDVATGAAGTPIAVGFGAAQIAITPDGTRAYVTNISDDTVSRIDLASGTVTTIPVGAGPIGIAITPDGKAAYVANQFDDTVSRIDLATNAVTTIAVGNGPTGIAITPNGTRAYVVNQFAESVSRIDVVTGAVTTIPLPGTSPYWIAITPNGLRAYVVSNFGSAVEVVAVNLAVDTIGTRISLPGFFLEDIAITPNGAHAYVPSSFPEQVDPIDLATETALTPFNAGSRPEAVAIVPNQPPHAAFTSSPAAPTPGQTVSFSANPKDSDTDTLVARYDWDFGDGSSAVNAGPTPSHAYAKAGTYQVTVTETDFEGCSTSLVFTGQTAYCNGSSIARTTRTVVVAADPDVPVPPVPPAPATLPLCPSVKAAASTFIPKRRPGNVLPGVRVQLSTGVPAKLNVTASLLYLQDGKEASAGLGQISVDVNKWRRVRFTIPAELRQELPLGKPVKVAVRVETMPRDGKPCEATVVNRVLKVHVVKVFPDRVQAERPR